MDPDIFITHTKKIISSITSSSTNLLLKYTAISADAPFNLLHDSMRICRNEEKIANKKGE